MEKVINPIKKRTYNGRGYNVYCKIEYKENNVLLEFIPYDK